MSITPTLDSDGNVGGTQYLWGNDAMTPSDSYYRVHCVLGSRSASLGTEQPNGDRVGFIRHRDLGSESAVA
jgi:hypothetical protein